MRYERTVAVALAFGAIWAAGCIKVSYSQQNMLPYLDYSASQVTPTNEPLWQQRAVGSGLIDARVHANGVVALYDDMLALHATNVLTRRPVAYSVVLHDASDGEVLWKHELKSAYEATAFVSVGDPVVVKTDDELLALSASSGEKVWSHSVEMFATPVMTLDASICFLDGLPEEKDSLRAGCIDRREGTVRWEEKIPSGPMPWLARSEEELLVMGSGLRRYRRSDGALLAQTEDIAEHASVSRLGPGGDAILGDESGEITRIGADGTVWTANVGDRPIQLDVDPSEAILVVLSTGEENPTVHALTWADGTTLWSVRMTQKVMSEFAFGDGLLAFTTPTRLGVVGLTDGSKIADYALPTSVPEHRLPDRVWRSGAQTVVVMEGGLLAVDLSATPRERWRMALRGAEGALHQTRQDEASESTLFRRAFDGRVDPEKMERLAQGAQAISDASYDLLQAQLASTSQFVDDHTGPDSLGYTISPETAIAMRKRIQRAQRTAAMMQLSNAMTNFVMAAWSAIAKMQRQAVVERAAARVAQAQRLHQLSRQGRYFVRPIGWHFGQGVLVVDLETGRWQELITSPGEPVMFDSYMQFEAARLSDGRLFTAGLGMDSGRWRELALYGGTATTAFRSMLSYSLPDDAWRRWQTYEQESQAPKSVIALRRETETP